MPFRNRKPGLSRLVLFDPLPPSASPAPLFYPPVQVEGLQSCEFLNKLDLTVNFIDLDELESSVTAMEGNRHLGDLYMMGNPCQVRRMSAGSRSRAAVHEPARTRLTNNAKILKCARPIPVFSFLFVCVVFFLGDWLGFADGGMASSIGWAATVRETHVNFLARLYLCQTPTTRSYLSVHKQLFYPPARRASPCFSALGGTHSLFLLRRG